MFTEIMSIIIDSSSPKTNDLQSRMYICVQIISDILKDCIFIKDANWNDDQSLLIVDFYNIATPLLFLFI